MRHLQEHTAEIDSELPLPSSKELFYVKGNVEYIDKFIQTDEFSLNINILFPMILSQIIVMITTRTSILIAANFKIHQKYLEDFIHVYNDISSNECCVDNKELDSNSCELQDLPSIIEQIDYLKDFSKPIRNFQHPTTPIDIRMREI